ncbi:MAG: DUF4129 domain-containing protein [Proteobacteria bacterium]|nr:DUF4129 domain-containing protein [Pseudomonadota bacterium]
MRRRLAALVVMLAALPAWAGDPVAALDDCLARLDPVSDVGLARIEARCPGLTAALEGGSAARLLPKGWKEPDSQLGAPALRQLREVLVREQDPAPVRHAAPDVTHVADIVGALKATAADGWWQRFKGWLRQLFSPDREDADGGWMEKLLEQLGRSQNVARIIVWSTLAGLVALAVIVVLKELRVAGVLGGALPPLRQAAPGAATDGTVLTLAQVEAAEPSAQPGLLLELIAARLIALGRLPPARALTARELLRRAQLPEEPVRTPLENLTGVYERVRFSDQPLPAASLASAVAGGRAVLERLDLMAQAAQAT